MKITTIKSSELKKITLFLIDKKIIFHPIISPNGIPDFSFYNNKEFILILDRNLLIPILRLAEKGTLKDEFSLKLISSLLTWTEYNGITITAGLALMEYSHFKQGKKESNIENNVFLEIFNKTNLSDWLNLAMGRTKSISPIKSRNLYKNDFFIENDHLKMHYLEMLKISQLYFDINISVENKFRFLFLWIYDNVLICKYTIFYAVFVFGEKSKIFRNTNNDYDEIINKCSNQAWDLTYLSHWSSLYFNENKSKEIFLLATIDKELKNLFSITYKDNLDIFTETFGLKTGKNIIENMNKTLLPREKPEIDSIKLDKMILDEKLKLKRILRHLTTGIKNS